MSKTRIAGEIMTEAAILASVARSISALVAKFVPKAMVLWRIKTSRSRDDKARRVGGAHVLDCVGVRVIVSEVSECYEVIRSVHQQFEHLLREYDDYIDRPKPNGYRGLHTTILASDRYPVEIQVRTRQMHAVAEHGTASHSLYKLGRSGAGRMDGEPR